MTVLKYEDLSDESKEMLAKTHSKEQKNYQAKKLVNDFKPRIKYLVHIMNLQYYISKGLKLQKIHTLIKFKQEAFAETFIKMTTNLRKNAMTDFDKSMWKFINNVLFGKSMEGKSTKFLT